MNSSITYDEIFYICNKLKCKKAPGFDGITSEHVLYGGNFLVKCLTWLFNGISHIEQIPIHFKRGIIIPIPKGDKDKLLQDNHRGITLIPVFAKIYEKCILKRVELSKILKHILVDLQGVTQEKCSSMHTAWLIKEVIAHHVEKGNSVYVGLLDI